METLEFTLIVMACVIVSAIVGKIVTRVALPLIQILVGFVVALFAPAVTDVHLSSELLMVLFIAPLLLALRHLSEPPRLRRISVCVVVG